MRLRRRRRVTQTNSRQKPSSTRDEMLEWELELRPADLCDACVCSRICFEAGMNSREGSVCVLWVVHMSDVHAGS
jgi:hypothetical protein